MGHRGLRARKLFYQVFDSQEVQNLYNNFHNFIENFSTEDISLEQSITPEHRQNKPEFKLPNTNEECSTANEYLKGTFNLSKDIMGVYYELNTLQDNVYNCFKRTYGTVTNSYDTFRQR